MKKNMVRSMRLAHGLQIAVVILLVLALNAAAVGLSRRVNFSLDLTANSRYALSDANREFLQGVDQPVNVYVLADRETFSQSSTYTTYVSILLDQYAQYETISLNYVDYTRDPTFASRFPDLNLAENGIVIECEGRATALQLSDLFEYSYSSSEEIQITAIGEARLAAAITDVLMENHARAVVLTGNGAQSVAGLQELLDANGFEVSEASLAMGNVDAQADLLLLIAPTVDLTAEQVSYLETWLKNGGEYGKTLFYAADVTQPELPRLEALIREWGVSVDDGAVFETSADRTSQNQPFFATTQFVDESYAQAFADAGAPIVAPMARPLTLRFSQQEGYSTRTILQFSETSGVRPSDAAQNFSAADATRWGPIPALVESTLTANGNSSRLYVCASTSLLDSTILEGNAFLNRQFLLKLFSNLTGGMDLSNFVGKKLTDETVHISTSTANTLGIAVAIALPAALFAVGVAVFIRRRRL